MLRAVLDAGIRRIDLGVGGSATTDGGLGILAALGLGMTVEPELVIHLDELDPRLGEVDLRIASDVTNPLLGAERRRRRLRPAERRLAGRRAEP